VRGKIPGILHMHGGGQRAQREVVEAAAANGYASISINWSGKPMDDQKPGDAGTDWGALDATQTTHNSHYAALTPDAKTIDDLPDLRRITSPLLYVGPHNDFNGNYDHLNTNWKGAGQGAPLQHFAASQPSPRARVRFRRRTLL